MAKQTNKNESSVMTVENVVENARKGKIMSVDLKKKMDEELQKENDEKIISEVKCRHTKIAYLVGTGLINVRKMRGYEANALYNVRQQGRLQRFLCGFTVTEQIVNEFAKTPDDILELETFDEKKKTLTIKIPKDGKSREEKVFNIGDEVPPVIDYIQFDEAIDKLREKLNERTKEVDNTYSKEILELRKAAGEYWSYDWQYNLRVVNVNGTASGY